MARPPLAFMAIALVSGCSGGAGSLSGTVRYQDKPVIYGTVMAQCSDGITRSANITPDGRYEFPSLPKGPVHLAVVSPEPPDLQAENRRAERSGGKPAAMPTVDRSKWQALPAKFGDPRTSGQRTKVDSAAVMFDIAL